MSLKSESFSYSFWSLFNCSRFAFSDFLFSIPVDIQKGAVFYRRVKNWKIISDEFQEFAYQRNWGIIEPWDGLAKYYNCLD